jgi:hypothetical protein
MLKVETNKLEGAYLVSYLYLVIPPLKNTLTIVEDYINLANIFNI